MPRPDASREPAPDGIRLRPLPPGATVRDVAPEARPSTGRTLRIALVMRGGVSLAVWIGGVAAELDVLRRIRLFDVGDERIAVLPHPGGEPPTPALERRALAYARLLDRAGYDRVEVDLLAGASAGGLNAVVYSVAQRAGITLDGLLGTWGEVGGFWGLLHGPGAWTPRALMQGEGYFRPRVLDALAAMHGSTDGHDDLVPEYVSVDLSTTIIDGGDQFEEDIVDGRGHFHFVGSDAHHLDNLVPRRAAPGYPGKPDDDRVQLDQLALAARSTSSLAGGFEPAEIASTEWPAVGDLADPRDPRHVADPEVRHRIESGDRTAANRRDLRFAFAAHRPAPAEPFRVIDGAVFDNVPIDRALRAAKVRESTRRADRTMVFIDPEPDPAFVGAAPWDPDATRFFRAVGAMFSKSMRRESVAREASDLHRFNGGRSIEQSRRLAGAGLLATADGTPAGASGRDSAYVRAMGRVVAERLSDALGQPSLWQLQAATRRRRRYVPIDRAALAGLEAIAVGRFTALADGPLADQLAGPMPLADAASCVLAWTRDLESVPERPGTRAPRDFEAVRGAAYAALRDANGSLDLATERVLLETLRTCAANRTPTADELGDWLTTWIEACAAVDATEHWRALDRCLVELAAATADIEGAIDAHGTELAGDWRRSPWRAIGLRPPARAIHLAPLAYPIGIPASLSRVEYWSIGVDERPAASAAFTELQRDRFLTHVQTALRTPRRSVDAAVAELNGDRDQIDRQTKLAGYGFGNFLGFLAKDWRVNDWWWGRLDGAAGLVRLLQARDPQRDPAADEALVEEVQDAVLADADEPALHERGLTLLSADAEGAGVDARARIRAGTDTLWNLDPGYRFALASRAIRLVDRAAAPVNRFLAAAVQAVLAVLRPVLVAVPAIADPPRLALVAGITAGTAWVLTWTAFTPTTGSILTAVVGVGAIAVSLAWGVIRSRRRWRSVRDGLESEERRRLVDAARIGTIRATAKYSAVAAASLAPLAIALAWANVTMSILCLGVSLAMTSVAVRAASGARPTTVPGRLVRTNLMVLVFVLLGGALPIAQAAIASQADAPAWLHALVEPPLERDLPLLAVGAVLVTIVLTADWLPLLTRRPTRFRLISWATVSVLAAAFGWAVAWALEQVMLAIGMIELAATSTAVAVFVVAWANAVWWLPEFRRSESAREDLVERRAPRPPRS
ncbi:DUF3376 domain-containing protein [Agromyces sp. LHK192]|uniref:DUF3376 domain-containing protein n=1 Tax=Agromyces sp. LHK192 TaxID=2498704 RepID=UPI000FDA51CF|nr:DUF3376 domain-containing protein [Agromyces sp. LHK192]